MKLWKAGKSCIQKPLRLNSGEHKFFFWKLYITTATASLKAEPAFPYRKHKAPMMMRQNRRILCIQGDSGPAGCTLLLHSSASHITPLPIHNPSPGWDGPGVKGSWWSCILIAVQCFASLPDLHLQLFSSLPPNFPSVPLFSIFEDVTEFSHQHEMFTVKSQVYFVQCAFAR